jgi:hypothetical protein
MNKDDNLINFPFLNQKYIILYDDNEKNAPILHEKYNFLIIIFLSNKSLRQYEDHEKYPYILEIYVDDFSEELLIKYSYCIIYLDKPKISDNLIKYLQKYNKLIINNQNINEYLDFLEKNPIDEDIIKLNEVSINFFNNISDNLNQTGNSNNTNNSDNNFSKNINITNKKINYTEYSPSKINILIFYLKHDIDIINVIQKKCIYENSKNKYVDKVYVFGENLESEITDKPDNAILNKTSKNITFKDFNDYAKEFLDNQIVCILRSDIILLNNHELDNLDMTFEIEETGKNIYTLSRSDRLINGNLVKYDKLNKILFSTEQDAWIFKSPLDIKESDNNDLDALSINNKYSELYFNNILQKNKYNLLNYTNKLKIIRILNENNLDNRPLLQNKITKNVLRELNECITLVPDSSIDNVSIDDMLKVFNVDSKEIYLLKCEFFNKYYKNKIIDEL